MNVLTHTMNILHREYVHPVLLYVLSVFLYLRKTALPVWPLMFYKISLVKQLVMWVFLTISISRFAWNVKIANPVQQITKPALLVLILNSFILGNVSTPAQHSSHHIYLLLTNPAYHVILHVILVHRLSPITV
jgi:hypothetical protein